MQAYLDQMSTRLLEKTLRASEEDSEVRTSARARMLTVLGRFDPSRKTAVIQFLDEGQLIISVDGKDPIVRLTGANLSNANLEGADIASSLELQVQVANLEFATMANGQKYEDWLKSRGGGEDGENSGPS